MGIEYYVAPYEADAQLAFLFHSGRVSAVITEDSDLLVFGVTKVFTKMDKDGKGIEYDLGPDCKNLSLIKDFDFKDFN